MQKKKVVILGGGIIGLSSAYYLQQEGHEVVVIDKNNFEDGCSFGNAGFVVPSHIIPLAAPGIITQGLKWMMDSESPFYIKPRINKDLISWCWKFYKNSTQHHVNYSIPHLKEISLLSKSLYKELIEKEKLDVYFKEKGLLVVCNSQHGLDEEAHVGKIAEKHGLQVDYYDANSLKEIEPNFDLTAVGAVHFKDDCHLEPDTLMNKLYALLKQRGVEFMTETEVQDFRFYSGAIKSVVTSNGEIQGDEYVICTGVWSSELLKKLGVNAPLQGGKGYNLTISNPSQMPSVPYILAEAKLAVSPMNNRLRIGGTMEVNGTNMDINPARIRGIKKSVPQFFPNFDLKETEVEPWRGLRPCSPDGLPYLGRLTYLKNAIAACGHAMLGLSLGPATGKLVSELVDDTQTSMPLKAFNPERYC